MKPTQCNNCGSGSDFKQQQISGIDYNKYDTNYCEKCGEGYIWVKK